MSINNCMPHTFVYNFEITETIRGLGKYANKIHPVQDRKLAKLPYCTFTGFLWGFLLLAYKTFSLLEAKTYDCDQSSLNEYEHNLHFS